MSSNPIICFACGKGNYQQVVEDYTINLPDEQSVTVPKLAFLRCDKCGEETIPPESSRRIEKTIDQQQDTLPAKEVQSFLTQFKIDQTEAAEALGMGAKTFHRWVRGTQRVSRSMGFFLRALKAHPEVFHWIRNRGWREVEEMRTASRLGNLTAYWDAEDQVRFPASYDLTSSCGKKPEVRKYNAARALLLVNLS